MANIELVLRATSGAVPGHVYLVLGGDSTQPQVVFDGTASGVMVFSGSAVGTYDNAVSRGVVAQSAFSFYQAAKLDVTLTTVWRPSLFKPTEKRLVWQAANTLGVDLRPCWQKSQPLVQPVVFVPWTQAKPVSANATAHWRKTTVTPIATTAAWDMAKPAAVQAALAFDYALFKPKDAAMAWDTAKPKAAVLKAPFNDRAKVQQLTRVAPWDRAKPVHSFGGAWSYVIPQNPPPYVQPRDTNLVLCCLQPRFPSGVIALILGGDPCVLTAATTSILPARFYMQVHNITAELLPQIGNSGGVFIDIPSVTVAADAGSFCWSFSAAGHISLFDQLMPVGGLPQRIRFTIDGIAFIFIVGPVRQTEAFGKQGVQFSGHSVTKLLSDPYARAGTWFNSTAQTAQQLAENVLQYTGVTLDWGVTDWLVPAGAWSHHGTPLSAVQSIAASIGGYVQSHRADPVLQVCHPYPLLAGGLPGGPWNWYAAGVTPDVSLASEALMTIGTERRDGADLNAVDVSGSNQGVWRTVKRIGTAGEKTPGSPVVDPLITADEAASQRGLSILGAAGAKHFIDFELPILTGIGQPGILDVGQLALVNQINHLGQSTPWRGRLRGVSASASFGGKVRQTINVERHLEVAP